MKRFLIGVCFIIVVLAGGFYMVCYNGFYIDLHSDAGIVTPFITQEKEIQVLCPDGSYASLEIRGVDLLSIQPGKHFSDYAYSKEDYLRYLEQIQDMGANTIRVYTRMDDDFYNALYEYNTTHELPLYLLQGIQVSDAANYGSADAYHENFLGELLEDAVVIVDVIHGFRICTATDTSGSGWYFKDISPWVLGYLVGNEWYADTIAYTDHSSIRNGVYSGEYFTTAADATAFEAMLAQVMDRIISYETAKYKTQRPIGFSSAPDIDFLTYESVYARQLEKYAWLDAEHIQPTVQLESGYYTVYRMFDFCEDFSQYLDAEQAVSLESLLAEIDTDSSYSGYLDLLGAYHTMPVIITAGYSSARGTVRDADLPLTEEEQGQKLMDIWQDSKKAGITGMCITAWQDNWEARTWNTAFAMDLGNNYLWHDLLSSQQNTGLLDFEPGEEAVCLLDGDPSEWEGEKPVLCWNDISLYLRMDQEGLYLLLLGEESLAQRQLYLPIDLAQKIGSTYCTEPALEFNREADFVLCLDGRNNTRLLVQERYDAMRMNFNFEQGGTDPFIDTPQKDGAIFSIVKMAVKNTTLIDLNRLYSAMELRNLRAMRSWTSGSLLHGNGNPNAAEYNSLADFCFGECCVELRIPWLLLNVSNPCDMQVHKDYYTVYGVEQESIRSCWIGLGDEKEVIEMSLVKLSPLGRQLQYRERLKSSYYIVQNYWKFASEKREK